MSPAELIGAQALHNILGIKALMKLEQLQEISVLDAEVRSVTCPVLLELICEALTSSGEKPKGLWAFGKGPTSQECCSSVCRSPVKIRGPRSGA